MEMWKMNILRYVCYGVYAAGLSCSALSKDRDLVIKPQEVGVYHGAFVDTDVDFTNEQSLTTNLNAFEHDTKINLDVVTIQSTWQDGIRYPENAIKKIHELGRIPLLRIIPVSDTKQETMTADPIYDLRKLIQGDFDRDLEKLLCSMANLKGAKGERIRFMVVFGPEVNGYWYSYNGLHYGAGTKNGWGDRSYPDGPEIFRDAYRHIIDLSRRSDINADNITWVQHFDMQGKPFEAWNSMHYYYAGDDYIDWVGFSAFGAQRQADLQWYNEFAEIVFNKSVLFKDRMQEFNAVSSKAYKAVLEFGVIEDPRLPERKARWIRDAFHVIKTRLPEIKLVNYWHESAWDEGGYSDLRVNSSELALDAYQNAVRDPYFQPQ
jgi:hypothetical protein